MRWQRKTKTIEQWIDTMDEPERTYMIKRTAPSMIRIAVGVALGVILALLLSGCTCDYHARKLVANCPGYFDSDTVYQVVKIPPKFARFSIPKLPDRFLDPAIFASPNQVILKIDTVKDSIRFFVNCPEDSITNAQIRHFVNDAPRNFWSWYSFLFGYAAGIISALILFFALYVVEARK